EMRSLRRHHSNFHVAVPRIISLLSDLEGRAIFQAPIELRIIVEMQINSIAARAVEIARQRSDGAFKVWWPAVRVVPRVSNLVPVGKIECQWVSITVERTVKRHPRIDTVIQRPFDDIGELRVAGSRKHSPVPHHVADGSAVFPVGPIVWQFVGIAEVFAIRARANSSSTVYLFCRHVVPQRVECFLIGGIASFHIVVGRSAASIHGTDSVSLKLGSRCKWRPAEHVYCSWLWQLQAIVSLEDVGCEIKLPLVT